MATSHRKETIPLSETSRRATGSVQYLLEYPSDPIIHHGNHLRVAICGKESFGLIAADIERAKKSIDLICWGFDPAMELVREGGQWPRGTTYGDLLADAAEKRDVQVRLLCWYDPIGSSAPVLGANNMPGFSKQAGGLLASRDALPRSKDFLAPAGNPSMAPASVQQNRTFYNADWYRRVFGGQTPIAIRTRTGDKAAVHKSLSGSSQLDGLGELEAFGLENLATHHQKTILIDHEGDDPVGYVMGLNSVTDYWDTEDHVFDDPRRGAQWEGDSKHGPGLKPFQDYVCRVQGPALVELHKNFSSAWERAKRPNGSGPNKKPAAPSAPATPAAAPKPSTAERLAKAHKKPMRHRAQIVRTQPEEGERTIERLYCQASSFARHYLYVENQYFQYTDWAVQLKKDRTAFAENWQAANAAKSRLPTLHVMVVIPTPERDQMVPRTHDTVKTLGHGTSMPNQNKAVEDELRRNRQQQAAWEAHVARQKAKGEVPDPAMYPAPLSDIARTAKEAGDQQTVDKELETIGMRTLVGSLWSCDGAWAESKFPVFEKSRKEQAVFDRAMEAYRKSQDAGAAAHGMPQQPPSRKKEMDEARAARYREIYIHSKLMIIDDSMFTLGSANLNLRSMAVDSEINIASDDVGVSTDLRRRVWGVHTKGASDCDGGDGSATTIKETFKNWKDLMSANSQAQRFGKPLVGFLLPFKDERTSSVRLG